MGRAGQTRESRQAELRASQQESSGTSEGSGHQLGCQIDENKETRVLEILEAGRDLANKAEGTTLWADWAT